MKNPIIKRIIFATVALLFAVVALVILNHGMTQIKDARFLARLQIVPIKFAIQGDYLIKGRASLINGQSNSESNGLLTPLNKNKALVYSYRIEEEETDSDGDTSWNTIHYEVNAIDFNISDASDFLIVNLNKNDLKNTSIEYSYSSIEYNNNYRYTEKWIAPNDELTLFGARSNPNNKLFNVFPSSYSQASAPHFINSKGEEAQLKAMSSKGVFAIWIGLSLITLSLILFLIAFKIHRIIKFLSLLTVIQFVLLLFVGSYLITQDIKNSIQYINDQAFAIKSIDDVELKDDFTTEYYQPIYSNTYHQINQFPENIYAFFMADELPEADFDILNISTSKIYMTGKWVIWVLLVLIILFVVLLWVGLIYTIRKRMIENVPTSKIKAVMVGLTEIKATTLIHNDQTLLSPISNTPCCWYDYKKEERQKNGKKSEWRTIESKTEFKIFKCEDGSDAQMVINPIKSDISSSLTTTKKEGKFRYSETYLPFNHPVFIFGNASISNATGNLMMKNEEDQKLIISTSSESDIVQKIAIKAMFLMGGVFSASILFGLLSMATIGSYEPSNYVLLGLLVPFFLIFMVVILHYNDLLFLRNRVDRNFSNIQVSLKKRFDLLTNLQNVVKGYMAHENKLQELLSSLRGQYSKTIKASDISTSHQVDALIKKDRQFKTNISVVLEEYPELKANELIQDFMARQIEMENEISLIRDAYNDAVNFYNERIQSFPDVLLAKRFGFIKKRYA